jgi:NAD(P)H-flavin reductase
MTDDPGWEGETRRIDAALLREKLADDLTAYRYLIAGPPAMVEAMSETVRQEGVAEEQVQAGSFSGY